MRLDDPELVRREYEREENLATRRETIARFLEGRNAVDVAFEAVAEAEPASILEVGSGLGEFAERLRRELGAEVVAVDLSPRMIELARARGVGGVVGDVRRLPFEDAAFDCAVANWMLYHVPDLERALAELARVLRPGGRLIAATLGEGNLFELRELLGEEGRPVRTFSGENGAALLERHFRTVERRDVVAALVFPGTEALRRYVRANIVLAPLLERVPVLESPFRTRTVQTVFVAET